MRAEVERGVMAVDQVVDVRVTLYDCLYHSVDSSPPPSSRGQC